MVEYSTALADVGRRTRSTPIDATFLARLAGDLAAAFVDDPIIDWIAPGEDRKARLFANLFRGLRPSPEWVQTAPNGEAAAVWVPSERLGAAPTLRELAAVPGMLSAAGVWRSQRLARFGLSLQVRHPHDVPHDYLMLLGVRPEARRRGAGSTLLASHLRRLDGAGRGAFLETSNLSNIPFYERHGFERFETFRPVGGGPQLWSMWRPPGPVRLEPLAQEAAFAPG
jgi:ribosomal protein S18 acetylase RimI-like enzyme